MYHNGCVSDGVFWYDHAVAVLVPLWRLVLHVRDGDSQLYWTAPVPTICSNYFPGDVSPLLQKAHTDEEKRKEKKGEDHLIVCSYVAN